MWDLSRWRQEQKTDAGKIQGCLYMIGKKKKKSSFAMQEQPGLHELHGLVQYLQMDKCGKVPDNSDTYRDKNEASLSLVSC